MPRIWIDTDTGSWGDADNLVIMDATEAEVEEFQDMTDNDICNFGQDFGTIPVVI